MLAPAYKGRIVPWTTPWTGEEGKCFLDTHHFAPDMPSICQPSAQGSGYPIFGSVHYQRQRVAVVMGRCDVCGKMIRPGQARVLLHPGNCLKGTAETGHVMAPSHRECARQAALVCPWITAEIEAGKLTVTVVKKARIAMAILDPEAVEAETGFKRKAFGHAKLIVDRGLQRDAEWLLRKVEIA